MLPTMFKSAGRMLVRLHRDERGAEALEKLLIIGAIVLPLLLFLVVFRNKLTEFVSGWWETVHTDSSQGIDTTTLPGATN